ncbi:hypothetical protein ACWEFL_02750 [Streptomyces sp. NPDC004838]
MTNPQPSPYVTAPIPTGRPRMFNTTLAKVIWTLVPIVSVGLLAALPFVVAAVKGVIKAWVAAIYVAVTITTYGIGTLTVGPGEESPFMGFLITVLIATAATHTALLDHEKIRIGK